MHGCEGTWRDSWRCEPPPLPRPPASRRRRGHRLAAVPAAIPRVRARARGARVPEPKGPRPPVVLAGLLLGQKHRNRAWHWAELRSSSLHALTRPRARLVCAGKPGGGDGHPLRDVGQGGPPPFRGRRIAHRHPVLPHRAPALRQRPPIPAGTGRVGTLVVPSLLIPSTRTHTRLRREADGSPLAALTPFCGAFVPCQPRWRARSPSGQLGSTPSRRRRRRKGSTS